MKKNYKNYFLIIFFSILGIVISSTFCYGAIASTMKVSGIANTRFTKDVRVTRFSISECSSGTISSYEEFNKDSVSTHIKFPNYNSYIIYNVSVRNYGNVKMGIKEIVGQNSNLNYELIDYKLHDVIKDVNGNTKGGATKNFKIKISPRNTLDANVNLTFKFAMIYDVTYTLIQDNNYPKEAMEGIDFNLTFTEPIPKYLDIFINGNSTSNFTYNSPNLTINAINGNINIKLSERAYLKYSGYNQDFKANYNVRNQIKTVSFVKYDNSSDSTNLGTWDMSEGQDKSVMAWLDANYNLFIGSKYKIYGKDLTQFFSSLEPVESIDFSNLDTSEVYSMMNMFDGCKSIKRLDLSGFDTRNVTFMSDMFYNTKIDEIIIGNNYVFTNQDGFPVSKYDKWFNSKKEEVTPEQISGHADKYTSFIQGIQLSLDTEKFQNSGLLKLTGKITFSNNILPSGITNTISVNDNDTVVAVVNGQDTVVYNTISSGGVMAPPNCNDLFRALNAVSLDLTGLNTSNVNLMKKMFFDCSNLKEILFGNFDTSKVTDMGFMFQTCISLTTLDLSSFDTSNVTDMSQMFYECKNLQELDLSNLNTSNVTDMSSMFSDCLSLTSLDLSSFNTSKVTDMGGMFAYCKSITSLDLSSFDTSKVFMMSRMLIYCRSLKSLDLRSFNTVSLEYMAYMFSDCSSLTSLDLSSFDTSKVTDMGFIFYYCNSITNLDLSSFDTSKVTRMTSMFAYCKSITSLDLSSFDTSKVTDMDQMFCGCDSITNLDLSSFDFTNVTNMSNFLDNRAPSLTVYYNTQASLDKIKSSSNLNSNIAFVQKNAPV